MTLSINYLKFIPRNPAPAVGSSSAHSIVLTSFECHFDGLAKKKILEVTSNGSRRFGCIIEEGERALVLRIKLFICLL